MLFLKLCDLNVSYVFVACLIVSSDKIRLLIVSNIYLNYIIFNCCNNNVV